MSGTLSESVALLKKSGVERTGYYVILAVAFLFFPALWISTMLFTLISQVKNGVPLKTLPRKSAKASMVVGLWLAFSVYLAPVVWLGRLLERLSKRGEV